MVKRPTTNDLPVCSVESVRRGGSGLEWLQLFRDYPPLHPSAYLAELKTSANEAGSSTLDVAVVLNTWEVIRDVGGTVAWKKSGPFLRHIDYLPLRCSCNLGPIDFDVICGIEGVISCKIAHERSSSSELEVRANHVFGCSVHRYVFLGFPNSLNNTWTRSQDRDQSDKRWKLINHVNGVGFDSPLRVVPDQLQLIAYHILY